MSEESTTTIKAGEGYDAWWDVAKGTVAQRKAELIEAAGLVEEEFQGKTLYKVASAAALVAQAEFKGARAAAKQGWRPPTTFDNPGTTEPEEQYGLAAFVMAAKSYDELLKLRENNLDQWTDELTELAKKRKEELTNDNN